ncbi:MAG: hypothetical protein FJY47_05750, partial [Betaproteobacteria bacterium]|nr:hypothetical protein [Betaproteobacteria bacterium]
TELFAWGGEPILRDGAPVGELSSVGYSAALDAMVALGFVRSACPEDRDQVLRGAYSIEVSGTTVPARAMLKAPGP